MPKNITGHNLLKLANYINLTLTISEQELLTRLSRNSIWAARYPIPYESEHMGTTDKLSNGQKVFSAYFSPRDMDEIDKFIHRLRRLAKEELNTDI